MHFSLMKAYKLALEDILDAADEKDRPDLEDRLKNYREVMDEAIKAALDDYKEKRGFEKEEVLENKGEKMKVHWSFPDLGSQRQVIDKLTKKISEATEVLTKLNALDDLQKLFQKQIILGINSLQMREGQLDLTKIITSSFAKEKELGNEGIMVKKENLKSEELLKKEIAMMNHENDQLKSENQLQKLDSESKIARLEDQLRASDLRVEDKGELILELRERIKGMDEIIRELRDRMQSMKTKGESIPGSLPIHEAILKED